MGLRIYKNHELLTKPLPECPSNLGVRVMTAVALRRVPAFNDALALTQSDSRKFSFGQCGRRLGVGAPSNIRSTLPVSCLFAKEGIIAGSGYNLWKVPPASISIHAAGSQGATLSTVPGQMKSYHKRGAVRSNL